MTTTHELHDLDLYDVSTEVGVVSVQCLPPQQQRVTVLVEPGTIAVGDHIHDRGVTMIVCGRAPWAERAASQRRPRHFVGGEDGRNSLSETMAAHDRAIAAGREAWTLRRVTS